MVFADLDNDGALDLAVGYPGGIGIFYGDGVQPREPRVHIPVPGAYCSTMVAADLDGDGYKEMLVQVESSIVILKNTCAGAKQGRRPGTGRSEPRPRHPGPCACRRTSRRRSGARPRGADRRAG